jgi:hypothetical protein
MSASFWNPTGQWFQAQAVQIRRRKLSVLNHLLLNEAGGSSYLLQLTIEELNRLLSANAQLKRKLQYTQSGLESIQKFLGGVSQPASNDHAAANHVPVAANSVTATPNATQPAVPKTETPVVRRNRGETIQKLNQIIDALVSWNTSQEDSDTQLRISIPTMKGLASAMGADYQPAIQEVLKERNAELEEHHSRLLIGTRHNATVGRKDEVLRAISREYLGLENWAEVKYQAWRQYHSIDYQTTKSATLRSEKSVNTTKSVGRCRKISATKSAERDRKLKTLNI